MEFGANPWEMLDDAIEILETIVNKYHADVDGVGLIVTKKDIKRIELLLKDYYEEDEEEDD